MRSVYAHIVQPAILAVILWVNPGFAADRHSEFQNPNPLPSYDFSKFPDVPFRAIVTADELSAFQNLNLLPSYDFNKLPDALFGPIHTADGLPDLQDPNPLPTYDFNKPPEGLFRSIHTAEGFDEELSFRRTHEIVPVRPTDVFPPSSPAVYIVFSVHQHFQPYQVYGICYPEKVPGLDPTTLIAQDVMYLALEDESGYVKLAQPAGGWKPGRYKVEIHVGFTVNELSLMGTMRFTVAEKP